jgi:Major capsid protein N-terminus/Large eukaryotic DNA virus major capsid protein
MPGGLLNIVSEGNNNVILNGNPTKTFFNVTYSKYTNFGLQKFRLDYEGTRDLRTSTPSQFKFKIKRYAELLMDTYLVINLPDIWSPFHEPTVNTGNVWVPYDFKWIKNLGTQIIKEVLITCGSVTIQKYTGDYLQAMVDRDFSGIKKNLFNNMSGNVPELNDPANAYGRSNAYPSAFYTTNSAGSEPSIRARQLLIPINTWFTLDNRCAFPLISLQYNELEITITLRPIQELFQIRDVYDLANKFPYVQPDFNRQEMQMYHFLQSPPTIFVNDITAYTNTSNIWNADIHLLCTYCFLSKAETELFAAKDQVYLVKDVFNYNFENVTGSSRVKLTSNGMVSSWMWYLQRNDVNTRNEWSNYSNWPYENIPQNVSTAPNTLPSTFQSQAAANGIYTGPGLNNSVNNTTGFFYTGDFNVANQKEILQTFGILLNGEYRENTLPSSIFNYIEKYTRTKGFAKEGLYCYNFCLNTDPFEYQPSGALNMSKFKTVELEITTYSPPIDPVNSNYQIICDTDGNPINTNKQAWQLYQYNYNMIVFEERYNVLTFMGGNCGMLYSR